MARFLTRKRLFLLLSPILLLAVLWVFRFKALAGIGNFLVIQDRLETADIIFLLNGDPTVRPYHAAKLFHQGLAPIVVMTRGEDSVGVLSGAYQNPTDTNIMILKRIGVPETQIVEVRVPGGVRSTFDEAKGLLEYCRTNSVRKVIVVTSELHSRRSRFIFRKVLAGSPVTFLLAPVPDRKYGANNWWTIEDGVIGCQNEYIKLLYYHLKY